MNPGSDGKMGTSKVSNDISRYGKWLKIIYFAKSCIEELRKSLFFDIKGLLVKNQRLHGQDVIKGTISSENPKFSAS